MRPELGYSSYYNDDVALEDEEENDVATENRRILEQRQKRLEERRYLERISELMGTTSYLLKSYAGLKLWEDGPNYQKVVKYVNNSQCHSNVSLKVVHIHRVWRREDVKGLFDIPNRMLLWHGTKRENIPNILNTGFILPVSTGQMFGPGIYFADRITKSSNYSDTQNAFLLLCEVGLGKMYSCAEAHNDWTGPPEGFDSVKGNGTYVPDWTDNGRFMGCLIPYGRTAKCTKYPSHAVKFNEFIVFDPERIVIRFLVEVEVTYLSNPRPTVLVTPKSHIKPRVNSRPRSTVQANSYGSNLAMAANRALLKTVTTQAQPSNSLPLPVIRSTSATTVALPVAKTGKTRSTASTQTRQSIPIERNSKIPPYFYVSFPKAVNAVTQQSSPSGHNSKLPPYFYVSFPKAVNAVRQQSRSLGHNSKLPPYFYVSFPTAVNSVGQQSSFIGQNSKMSPYSYTSPLTGVSVVQQQSSSNVYNAKMPLYSYASSPTTVKAVIASSQNPTKFQNCEQVEAKNPTSGLLFFLSILALTVVLRNIY